MDYMKSSRNCIVKFPELTIRKKNQLIAFVNTGECFPIEFFFFFLSCVPFPTIARCFSRRCCSFYCNFFVCVDVCGMSLPRDWMMGSGKRGGTS